MDLIRYRFSGVLWSSTCGCVNKDDKRVLSWSSIQEFVKQCRVIQRFQIQHKKGFIIKENMENRQIKMKKSHKCSTQSIYTVGYPRESCLPRCASRWFEIDRPRSHWVPKGLTHTATGTIMMPNESLRRRRWIDSIIGHYNHSEKKSQSTQLTPLCSTRPTANSPFDAKCLSGVEKDIRGGKVSPQGSQ